MQEKVFKKYTFEEKRFEQTLFIGKPLFPVRIVYTSNCPHFKVSLGRGSFNRKCKWCDINTVCLQFHTSQGKFKFKMGKSNREENFERRNFAFLALVAACERAVRRTKQLARPKPSKLSNWISFPTKK